MTSSRGNRFSVFLSVARRNSPRKRASLSGVFSASTIMRYFFFLLLAYEAKGGLVCEINLGSLKCVQFSRRCRFHRTISKYLEGLITNRRGTERYRPRYIGFNYSIIVYALSAYINRRPKQPRLVNNWDITISVLSHTSLFSDMSRFERLTYSRVIKMHSRREYSFSCARSMGAYWWDLFSLGGGGVVRESYSRYYKYE